MPGEYSVEELQKRIGYTFQNPMLLKQAITHSSFTNEQKINKYGDYERLEFLGDAVLELVSSEFLFGLQPPVPEGTMTKLRASYVCEVALAFCARDLLLGNFIRLGKGEEQNGGRKRDSIISDVMEALIGAMYIDGGMEQAKTFIHRFILSDLEDKQLFYDSKSILQETVQKTYHAQITYEILREAGPEHDKEFVVQVLLDGKPLGSGEGHSKKAAEQKAAYEALLQLKREE